MTSRPRATGNIDMAKNFIRVGRKLGRLVLVLTAAAATAVGHAQLLNEVEPLPGLTISGQPDESALAKLADDGFVAVIDLRAPEEDRGLNEQEAVEALGMKYISLPIGGPEAVNYENAAALEAILREHARPILIHCATGNRAGALLSLQQRLAGMPAREALATGVKAGMTSPLLRSTVEAQLGMPPMR